MAMGGQLEKGLNIDGGTDGTAIGNTGDSLKTAVTSTPSTGPVTPGTVATNSTLIGGQHNATLPTVQSLQQVALQVDSRGALIVTPSLEAPTNDAVNRLRVSNLQTLGSFCFANTPHDLAFLSDTVAGGSLTFTASQAAVRLSTGTGATDSIIRQTRRYYKYSPGESHRLSISGVIGTAKANVTKQWGHYDANDGLFFQQTGSGLSVVVRSSTSGSAVDTTILQSNWNLDKLDGTGPSGITLDVTKHNLYLIDFTWHGASRVRFGVFIGGKIIYCHAFDGSNTLTAPYMRTPYLPIRFQMTNTAAPASPTSMDIVCCALVKEAQDDVSANYNFSKSDGRTATTVGATTLPLISIRPRLTYNGITNRVTVQPRRVQAITNNQPTLIQIILNPTLTGAAFTNVDTTNSCTEFDISATAVTGGVVLCEYYIGTNTPGEYDLSRFTNEILLNLNIAGSVADILTIAAQSTAGNTNVFCNIQWEEFQ